MDSPVPVEEKMRTKRGRQQQRYALISELSVVYEGYSEEIPVRPPDISPQGIFINTPRHFPVGAVLKVRFGGADHRQICDFVCGHNTLSPAQKGVGAETIFETVKTVT